MTEDIVVIEYNKWRETGELIDDRTVVLAMFYKFDMLANVTVGIPKYSLVHDDARKESDRLRYIIQARGYLHDI